jgi:hypothetical protein
MKVGDLVKCTWQPRCGGYDSERQCLLPMTHHIENQPGFVTEVDDGRCLVLFPKFGYSHMLAFSALEIISESR